MQEVRMGQDMIIPEHLMDSLNLVMILHGVLICTCQHDKLQ